MPAIINKNGAERRIPLTLTEEETQKLQNSINIIKQNINSIVE
jgi:malate/lactate dehydrogenase